VRSRSLAGRLWNTAVGAVSAAFRSSAACGRFGRAVDRLLVPDALRGRLIALGVEAAGRAGYRDAVSGASASRFAWQTTRSHTDASEDDPFRGAPVALWVIPVAELGGVARHVLDATRQGIPGWRIVVLCPEGALARRLRAQGAAVFTAPFGPEAGFRASRASLARVSRALRPQIVHSHLAYADIVNAWTPLPRGTRRFTTEHGIAGEDSVYHHSDAQARIMALVHRSRFPRFDGVIAVSRATRDAMIAKWHVAQPVTVIPNGVEVPVGFAPHREDAETLRILSLARLAPEKRLDKLITAFALVKEHRPEATLTIAGDGPLRDELLALGHRLGVADSLSLPGHLDAGAAMDDADVLVQLSVWENCSYTLLDARARGMRIIASDAGGNGEIVERASLLRSVDAASVAAALLSGAHRSAGVAFGTAEMTAATAAAYGSGHVAGARS
jgi:glycosyltransferase involved in cell wall biosynthesis